MYNSNCVIFLPDLNKAKDAFVTFMRGPKSVHPEDRKVLIFINIAIICVTSVKVFWGIYFPTNIYQNPSTKGETRERYLDEIQRGTLILVNAIDLKCL